MDPLDEDFALPPPAYSEQNFDQKVLRATELSSHIAKWESKFELDDDGFPRYDPAMFEDKSTPVPALSGKGHPAPAPVLGSPSINSRPLPSTTSAGPSTLCPVAPLQISKKSLVKTQETGQVAASSFNRESTAILRSDPNENGCQTPVPSYDEHSGGVQEEDSDLVGQEIAPEQPQIETPSESQGSATPDPWSLGIASSNNAIEQPSFRHSINPEYRQPAPQHLSMPPRILPRIISSERPRSQSTIPTATVPHIPRVNFNLGMVYGNSTTPPPSRPIQSPQKPQFPLQYNPHALYNSAVSSQLNPSIATPDQPSTRSYQVQRSQVWPNQTYSPPTANVNRQWTWHPADGPPNNYSPLPESGAGPGYAHSMTDNRYISR